MNYEDAIAEAERRLKSERINDAANKLTIRTNELIAKAQILTRQCSFF